MRCSSRLKAYAKWLRRELFGGLEEALERGELVVFSPDGVYGEHRCQVDELHAAWKLLDQ
jgi:hypothetical protein